MNYIFFDGNILERAGGPSTYLYNLQKGIKEKKIKDIEFIYKENIMEEGKRNKINKYKKIIAKTFPKVYEKIMLNHILSMTSIHDKLKEKRNVELVHFHNTIDLSKAIKYLPKETIKVLMSHCPEIPSLEFKNNLKEKSQNTKYDFDRAQKIFFEEIDKIAFENANVLVFPSKEAMEPYYQTCHEFEELIEGKNIKYLMTGTKPLKYNQERNEFRKVNNIPKDAFVICFVGRHNEVKGYDNFIEIAKSVMEKEKNIYVVTAGVGNIESPKNDRWIDIGWTNDPGSVVNASDLFILPNKRTYFDLVLLEVLSIGKTCLISATGGNKTVEKLSKGVITYNDIKEATKLVLDLYKNQEQLKDLEKENKKTYEEYFTIEKFTENYIKMIEEIKKEKE